MATMTAERLLLLELVAIPCKLDCFSKIRSQVHYIDSQVLGRYVFVNPVTFVNVYVVYSAYHYMYDKNSHLFLFQYIKEKYENALIKQAYKLDSEN